jgi:hypothetical protein
VASRKAPGGPAVSGAGGSAGLGIGRRGLLPKSLYMRDSRGSSEPGDRRLEQRHPKGADAHPLARHPVLPCPSGRTDLVRDGRYGPLPGIFALGPIQARRARDPPPAPIERAPRRPSTSWSWNRSGSRASRTKLGAIVRSRRRDRALTRPNPADRGAIQPRRVRNSCGPQSKGPRRLFRSGNRPVPGLLDRNSRRDRTIACTRAKEDTTQRQALKKRERRRKRATALAAKLQRKQLEPPVLVLFGRQSRDGEHSGACCEGRIGAGLSTGLLFRIEGLMGARAQTGAGQDAQF